jgi:phage portal protein BeeE
MSKEWFDVENRDKSPNEKNKQAILEVVKRTRITQLADRYKKTGNIPADATEQDVESKFDDDKILEKFRTLLSGIDLSWMDDSQLKFVVSELDYEREISDEHQNPSVTKLLGVLSALKSLSSK